MDSCSHLCVDISVGVGITQIDIHVALRSGAILMSPERGVRVPISTLCHSLLVNILAPFNNRQYLIFKDHKIVVVLVTCNKAGV